MARFRYAVDCALALVVALPVSVPFLTGTPGEATVLGAILNAGTVFPLIWRRRAPFAVAVAVASFAIGVSVHHLPGQTLQYGGLVAIYTLADLGRPWQRRGFFWAILILLPVGGWLKRGDTVDLMFTVLLPLNAYLLGTLARTARARTEALAERARQLQRERETDAARVAAEERARIARDMHDVMAHAVSVMVVQAEAGPVALRSDPGRAEQVFDTIAEAGREAMTQLRQTLSVLKGEGPAGLTAAAIPALVARADSTKFNVRLRTEGTPRPLGSEADLAAYRIVQEALTNSMRHSAGHLATVCLIWRDEDLTVTVTDDGLGSSAAKGLRSPGRGLAGIRERAMSCGGFAVAGNAPGGGFRVMTRLPYTGRPASLP